MKRPTTIWVKNNGKVAFSDRYDGEDFTIEPGRALELVPEAAKLCLGFGEPDKNRVIRRLGWAPTQNDMPDALARLAGFSFHVEQPRKGHSSAPVGDAEAEAALSGASSASDPDGSTVKPAVGGAMNLLEKLGGAQAAAG